MARDDTKLLQAIISGQKALEERLTKEIRETIAEIKKNGERLNKQGARL